MGSEMCIRDSLLMPCMSDSEKEREEKKRRKRKLKWIVSELKLFSRGLNSMKKRLVKEKRRPLLNEEEEGPSPPFILLGGWFELVGLLAFVSSRKSMRQATIALLQPKAKTTSEEESMALVHFPPTFSSKRNRHFEAQILFSTKDFN